MPKTNRKKSSLKMLAADAKARLKSGCYNRESTAEKLPADYFMVVRRTFESRQAVDRERAFYNKVREILSEDSVSNPISRLIDKEELLTLSYSARQRYLLEISQKFTRIKNEIEAHG